MSKSGALSSPREKHVHELPRVLGIFSVVGIVVGTMIGSGIFINPPIVAAFVGTPELILAVWIIGGVLCLSGALSLAELGAAQSEAGGIYIHLREAYGQMPAFLFGWSLFLIIGSGSLATLAVAFSSKYLTYFVRLSSFQEKVISIAIILVLTVVNVMGVRKGANLMNVLTAVKFIALIGICSLVFFYAGGTAGNFRSTLTSARPAGSTVGNFGVALIAALWAYKGWENSTYSVGEVRRPQRTFPFGLLIGTMVVVFLYLVANLAYLYVFPAAEMAKSEHIASDVMRAAVGRLGASITSVIILMSIFGTANSHVMTAPRALYAMARDGFFFKSMAKVHPRYRTPHIAIIVFSLWGCGLAASGTFEGLLNFVMFGYWIFMGLAVAGVIVMRRKDPNRPRPYKAWGYPLTPVLFVLGVVLLTGNSLVKTFWNSFAGLGIIAAGIPIYYFWKLRRKGKAG
jgi:APA family basic amino acid/polyamine antiporter